MKVLKLVFVVILDGIIWVDEIIGNEIIGNEIIENLIAFVKFFRKL
jgi:hypothetical protein